MKAMLTNVLKLSIVPLAFGLAGCHTTNSQSAIDSTIPSLVPAMPVKSVRQQDLSINESAKICFATAQTLEQGGKDAEAIALYDKARQLDKHFTAASTRRLAVLFDRNGEFDKALAEYRRGLSDNPKDAELLSDLGYGYYCRAEWAEAEKNLRKAVAANPKLANAWINLGMTLAQQARYDESLAAFGKVVSEAQARCNVAFIQVTQDKVAEAKNNYESALRLEPGLQLARIALQKMNQPNFRARTPTDTPTLANADPAQTDAPVLNLDALRETRTRGE